MRQASTRRWNTQIRRLGKREKPCFASCTIRIRTRTLRSLRTKNPKSCRNLWLKLNLSPRNRPIYKPTCQLVKFLKSNKTNQQSSRRSCSLEMTTYPSLQSKPYSKETKTSSTNSSCQILRSDWLRLLRLRRRFNKSWTRLISRELESS